MNRGNLISLAIVIGLAACSPSVSESTLPPSPLPTSFQATSTHPPSPTQTSLPQAPTGEPTVTPTPLPASWQDWPITPTLSERALEIYQQGLTMGNDPHRFSKVGDCQNTSTYFLGEFDRPGGYSLGEYDYLSNVITWYSGSYNRNSLAAKPGLNVASVISPIFSDPEKCEPGENLLACEVRLHNPSVILVSLDGNWEGRTAEEYEEYMRRILEFLINEGVLPILSTKADNLEGDHSINAVIVKLAAEYQIPLWNFWAAVQPLPNHGLRSGDDFYITIAGPHFDNPVNMKAAYPWRNLTALQSLDALLNAIIASEPTQ